MKSGGVPEWASWGLFIKIIKWAEKIFYRNRPKDDFQVPKEKITGNMC